MEKSIQQKNKDLVLKAFDNLFNKRDYATAETFRSPKYVQHAHTSSRGEKDYSTL